MNGDERIDALEKRVAELEALIKIVAMGASCGIMLGIECENKPSLLPSEKKSMLKLGDYLRLRSE